MTRLVTIGLDGAAWHKLDRMMDAGTLPNLERLVGEGTRAPLRSVRPPVTCPAWRCSTSGKNPGKLGVYWWLNLDRSRGEITSPDARSFDTADVWDYLSAAGYRSAVVNVPMTYPPSPIDDGVMVSGFGAPFDWDLDEAPLTRPPDLQERLEREYDWRVGVDDVTAAGGVEEALDVIESRFELLFDMLEEGYDYVHTTVFYVNVLQHKFGDGPETERAWRLVDDYLGRLPDGVTKLVYSDHGHDHVDRTFVVNKFLADRGDLTFESHTGDAATTQVYRTLKRVGVSPRTVATVAQRFLPEAVYRRLVESGYPVPTFQLARRVDWDESNAVALSQGPLYLNRERLGDDYESFRASLRADLESFAAAADRPLDRVLTASEAYDGPHLDAAPDLVLVPNDGWEIYGGITPSVVEDQVTSWTSGNDPTGMLLVHGPDVQSGSLGERSLLDVMPTVLRYFDCAVPTDVDGDTVAGAFRRDFSDEEREPIRPERAEPGGSDAALERRLEDLGYLE
jgi:predicted AlkP superfamily phosphohydrolase/phosphomutase